MPEVYWVYSDFGSAPKNDSKLQERPKPFLIPRVKETFQVLEVYWVYSDFDSAPGNDSKFQERPNYSKFPERKKYFKCLGYAGSLARCLGPKYFLSPWSKL